MKRSSGAPLRQRPAMRQEAAAPAPRRSPFAIESKALLRLGAPMVATQMFIMGIGFLDTLLAGRYSSVDLAGVALGGNFLWPIFLFMTGLTMAITPMVAQLVGAKRTGDSGPIIRQGLWIALLSAAITMIIVRQAGPVFVWMDLDPQAAAIAADYLKAVSWGMPAVMVYLVLRYSCEGLGNTRPPMLIAGAAFLLNAPLNYLFIYGALGFPELGGVGCGWATALVMWLELALITFFLRRPFFRATRFMERFSAPQLAIALRILKIGLPIGAAIFMEMALFSIIGFLIAGLGVQALAAHSIAGTVSWMTYVIPMSLGSAAAIRVGFRVGAQDRDGARRVALVAFQLSLAYALAVSALMIGLRHALAGIFTTDPVVVAIAANLMIFIALYQLFDDSNAAMAGALRGYKDTRMPMLFSLVGYWLIALPLGHLLATGALIQPGLGVYGYWAGLAVGLLLVALAMGARLRHTSGNDALIQRLALG